MIATLRFFLVNTPGLWIVEKVADAPSENGPGGSESLFKTGHLGDTQGGKDQHSNHLTEAVKLGHKWEGPLRKGLVTPHFPKMILQNLNFHLSVAKETIY